MLPIRAQHTKSTRALVGRGVGIRIRGGYKQPAEGTIVHPGRGVGFGFGWVQQRKLSRMRFARETSYSSTQIRQTDYPSVPKL